MPTAIECEAAHYENNREDRLNARLRSAEIMLLRSKTLWLHYH